MSDGPKKIKKTTGGLYFENPTAVSCMSLGYQVLDKALGGGVAEGRVFNVVGDKCLAGDTIVSVKRGIKPKKMTLEVLFNRHNGQHWNKGRSETYLLADIGDYVGMSQMLKVSSSGEKQLYEITSTEGRIIKATEDHKFLASDGWTCLKDGLSVGTMVKCWRGTRNAEIPQRNKQKRSQTYSIPYHPFAHRNFVAGRDYKRLPTARLVVEAAINGVDLIEFIHVLRHNPEKASTFQYTNSDLEIHHLDGDSTNDCLENLQLLSSQDHWATHAGEMASNVKTLQFTKIKSIKKIGVEATFDVAMKGPHHNFIANGFVVHNSCGKTLLGIELCANFALKYTKEQCPIRFMDAEYAFDIPYAKTVGLPDNRVVVPELKIDTVEDWFIDLENFCDKVEGIQRTRFKLRKDGSQSKDKLVKLKGKSKAIAGLYILDSLDAISDAKEMEDAFGRGTYGTAKPKQIGKLFRKLIRRMGSLNVTLFIISQTRDNINASFGEKHTRSGGKALDFYASQILWLANLGQCYETKNKVKRPTGVDIRAKCKKNKVGLPFRECDFRIRYAYGIDEFGSAMDWLESVGKLNSFKKMNKSQASEYLKKLDGFSTEVINADRDLLNKAVDAAWWEIERSFLPMRRKYQ